MYSLAQKRNKNISPQMKTLKFTPALLYFTLLLLFTTAGEFYYCRCTGSNGIQILINRILLPAHL